MEASISEEKRSFGEILHYARKTRGLTIKQLEKKSGVSASFISRIENDSGNPSVEIVRKLAEALGIPLSDFFHDQKGGKILYPLRLAQARLLQDPAVNRFLDQLISLMPEQRAGILQIAGQVLQLYQNSLVPAGQGLYRLRPGMLGEEQEPGDGGELGDVEEDNYEDEEAAG